MDIEEIKNVIIKCWRKHCCCDDSIEQPAGHGCGYGITEDGQQKMRIALNDFLSKTN